MNESDDDSKARPTAERRTIVVRPGAFITAVILSCMAVGFVIYWLLRGMRI